MVGYINRKKIGRYRLPALDRSGLYVAQVAGGIWVKINIGISGMNGVFSRRGVKQENPIDNYDFRIDRTILIGFLTDEKLWVSDAMKLVGMSLLASPFFDRWNRVLTCMDMLEEGSKFFELSEPRESLFVPMVDSLEKGMDRIEIKPKKANLITTRQDGAKSGFFYCLKGDLNGKDEKD